MASKDSPGDNPQALPNQVQSDDDRTTIEHSNTMKNAKSPSESSKTKQITDENDSDKAAREAARDEFIELEHNLHGRLTFTFYYPMLLTLAVSFTVFGVSAFVIPAAIWKLNPSSKNVAPWIGTVPALISLTVLIIAQFKCCGSHGPIFNFLFWRPAHTRTLPFLTGWWTETAPFRRGVHKVVNGAVQNLTEEPSKVRILPGELQWITRDEGQNCEYPNLQAHKATEERWNGWFHPGQDFSPKDFLNEFKRPTPSGASMQPLPWPVSDVIVRYSIQHEDRWLAATGGYRELEYEAAKKQPPLFHYRSVLNSAVLLRLLVVGWVLFGIQAPVSIARMESIGCQSDFPEHVYTTPDHKSIACVANRTHLTMPPDVCCPQIERLAGYYAHLFTSYIVLGVSGLMIAVSSSFWPDKSTSGVIRRSLDVACREYPAVRWLREQALAYDRLTLRRSEAAKQNWYSWLPPILFSVSLIAGLFVTEYFNSTVQTSFDAGDASSWTTKVLFSLIAFLCTSILKAFVIDDYNSVVVSSHQRLGFFTYLLSPGKMEEQLHRFAQSALERTTKPLESDSESPLNEALREADELFLHQLRFCNSVMSLRQYTLRTWLKARMFTQQYDSSLQLSGAAWVISGLVVSLLGFSIAFFALFYLVQGNFLGDPSIPILLFTSVGFACLVWFELRSLICIYQCTEEQLQRLSEIKIELNSPHVSPATTQLLQWIKTKGNQLPRFEHVEDSNPNEALMTPQELIGNIYLYLQEHDEPPRVLGIALTPSFLTILQGYIVAAATAAISSISFKSLIYRD